MDFAPMDSVELLVGLAGVAVSLAGFSGLVVAIRTSAASSWHPRDIWSLSWMLGASMGALFIALLPILLTALGVAEQSTWMVTSFVVFTFMTFWATLMAVYDRRLKTRGYPPRVRYFPTLAFTLFMGCGGLALLATIGVLPRVGIVMLGLIASLFAAALALVVFLVVLAREAAAS